MAVLLGMLAGALLVFGAALVVVEAYQGGLAG